MQQVSPLPILSSCATSTAIVNRRSPGSFQAHGNAWLLTELHLVNNSFTGSVLVNNWSTSRKTFVSLELVLSSSSVGQSHPPKLQNGLCYYRNHLGRHLGRLFITSGSNRLPRALTGSELFNGLWSVSFCELLKSGIWLWVELPSFPFLSVSCIFSAGSSKKGTLIDRCLSYAVRRFKREVRNRADKNQKLIESVSPKAMPFLFRAKRDKFTIRGIKEQHHRWLVGPFPPTSNE